tara:strand:+ start:151 stop:981 length:831 start_codon:yes stop_codon:yes gene_type:complete
MPVYKGTTEITSGKLYKATTNIENGYKGTNSFYVNETTLTVQFVNNTNLTALDASSYTLTGIPGQAITEITYGLRSTSAQRIDGLPSSESGDTGNNLTIASSFPTGNIPEGLSLANYKVNGTFPSTNKTIIYTLTGTITNLTALTASVSGNVQTGSTFGPSASGVYTSPSVSAKIIIGSTTSQYSAISSYLGYSVGQPPLNSTPFTTNRTVTGTITHNGSSSTGVTYSQPDSFQYTGTGSPGLGIGTGTSSVSVSLFKNSGYYITGSSSTSWLSIS